MRQLAAMCSLSFLVLAGALFPLRALADISQPVADTETTDPFTFSGGWSQELGTGLIGTTTEIDFPIDWLVVPPAGPTGGARMSAQLGWQCPSSSGITNANVLFGAASGTTTLTINNSTAESPFSFVFEPDCDYRLSVANISGSFEFPNIRFRVLGSATDTFPNGSTTAGGLADLAFTLKGVDYVGTTTATTTPGGVSNVLFLPGIESSRLYDGSEKQLWEPSVGSGDQQVQALSLDANGQSVDPDIHTKETGAIDNATVLGINVSDVYATFLGSLDSFCTTEQITCKTAPYDWRLSLDQILASGNDAGGNISYTQATDTPYIEQTLRELAATSKTGKVTIVAHSNGGLVAKALMEKLGPQETAQLIDKVIFVAVPQSGAPASIGELLVGYGAGIPSDMFPLLISRAAVRQFGLNAPMAYHLLPSNRYFTDVQDPVHPVVSFSGTHTYANQIADYGSTITTEQDLDDYLTASDGDRSQPATSDLNDPAVLNTTLIQYANQTHAALDAWVPPSGVQLYQIAGWGVDTTVAGVDFYEDQGTFGGYSAKYRPDFTEDGDGTVPVPSALMIPAGDNVNDYWFNLANYNKTHPAINHGTILSVGDINLFLQGLIQDSTVTSSYISSATPPPNSTTNQLHFFIHSPVTLSVYDSAGDRVGVNADGSFDEEIPGGSYGEFGEVKYVSVPADSQYQVVLNGQASGTFSLDVQETQDDVVVATTTFADIPTTASTTAELDVASDASLSSPLTVDLDGNGQPDMYVSSDGQSLPLSELLTNLTTAINGASTTDKQKTKLLNKVDNLKTKVTKQTQKQSTVLAQLQSQLLKKADKGKIDATSTDAISLLLDSLTAGDAAIPLDPQLMTELINDIQTASTTPSLEISLLNKVTRLQNLAALTRSLTNFTTSIQNKRTRGFLTDDDTQDLLNLLDQIQNTL